MAKKKIQPTLWQPLLEAITTDQMAPAEALRLLISGTPPEQAAKELQALIREVEKSVKLSNLSALRGKVSLEDIARASQQAAQGDVKGQQFLADAYKEATTTKRAAAAAASFEGVLPAEWGRATDAFDPFTDNPEAPLKPIGRGMARGIPDGFNPEVLPPAGVRSVPRSAAHKAKVAAAERGLTGRLVTEAVDKKAGQTAATRLAGGVGKKAAGRALMKGAAGALPGIGTILIGGLMALEIMDMLGVTDRIFGDREGSAELAQRFALADEALRAQTAQDTLRTQSAVLGGMEGARGDLGLLAGLTQPVVDRQVLGGIIGPQEAQELQQMSTGAGRSSVYDMAQALGL